MKSYLSLFLVFACFNATFAQNDYRPEIHCKHFFYGYPWGTPVTNDLIIRDIYALSSNDETKFADWVCYRLDTAIISGQSRSRNWKADPWLDDNETLEPKPDHGDYRDAHDSLATDRGHLAPLGSFDGSPYWYETNYLSNITPQKSDLNQGVWMRLETRVRELVKDMHEIYVITGTLYERDMPSLPMADEPHRIPSGYWKIIAYEEANGFIQAIGFIFDQNTPRSANMQDHVMTIDEIERRSKLDFLWLLPDGKEDAIEGNNNQAFLSRYFTE